MICGLDGRRRYQRRGFQDEFDEDARGPRRGLIRADRASSAAVHRNPFGRGRIDGSSEEAPSA